MDRHTSATSARDMVGKESQGQRQGHGAAMSSTLPAGKQTAHTTVTGSSTMAPPSAPVPPPIRTEISGAEPGGVATGGARAQTREEAAQRGEQGGEERREGERASTGRVRDRERERPPFTLRGYEVRRRIGDGFSSTVYLARRVSDGRKVAIKRMKGPRFLKSARNEAKMLLSALPPHENIVTLLELREERKQDEEESKAGSTSPATTPTRSHAEAHQPGPTQQPAAQKAGTDMERGRVPLQQQPQLVPVAEITESCLVFEYLDRGSLFERIVHLKTLTEADAKGLIYQVASALFVLHENGICHRDLKLENLVFQRNRHTGGETLKLVDFGFAALTGDTREMKRAVGTCGYVAPEVILARGKRSYGAGVDLWSLGVLLYMMLGGYRPFYSKVREEENARIAHGKYRFHKRYWSHISDQAKDLISKLLVVDPARRITALDALLHPWLLEVSRAHPLVSALQNQTLDPRRKLFMAVSYVRTLVKKRNNKNNNAAGGNHNSHSHNTSSNARDDPAVFERATNRAIREQALTLRRSESSRNSHASQDSDATNSTINTSTTLSRRTFSARDATCDGSLIIGTSSIANMHDMGPRNAAHAAAIVGAGFSRSSRALGSATAAPTTGATGSTAVSSSSGSRGEGSSGHGGRTGAMGTPVPADQLRSDLDSSSQAVPAIRRHSRSNSQPPQPHPQEHQQPTPVAHSHRRTRTQPQEIGVPGADAAGGGRSSPPLSRRIPREEPVPNHSDPSSAARMVSPAEQAQPTQGKSGGTGGGGNRVLVRRLRVRSPDHKPPGNRANMPTNPTTPPAPVSGGPAQQTPYDRAHAPAGTDLTHGRGHNATSASSAKPTMTSPEADHARSFSPNSDKVKYPPINSPDHSHSPANSDPLHSGEGRLPSERDSLSESVVQRLFDLKPVRDMFLATITEDEGSTRARPSDVSASQLSLQSTEQWSVT